MKIEGNGFLSEDLRERLAFIENANLDLFDLSTEMAVLGEELKGEFQIERQETAEEKQRVIAVVLFVRLLEVLQGTLILAAYGIKEELYSLLRVFLDAYFVLANCCSSPDFVPIYFQTDEQTRLKLMKSAAKHDSDLFKEINKYATKNVKDDLDKKIKNEKIQSFKSYRYAENVGCEEVYDSLYRLASASIHSTPRCLDNYVETDSEGNITLVKHQADAETTNHALYDISWFFLKALRGICELFELDHKQKLDGFEAALNERAARTEQLNPAAFLPCEKTGSEMTVEVTWEEVAAYLLAVEDVKKQKLKDITEAEFQILLDLLKRSCIHYIFEKLAELAYGEKKNRAAQRLLEHKCEDIWKKQTIDINSLKMAGGQPGTDFHSIAIDEYRGRPSPIEIGNEVKKGRLRGYIKGKKMPSFMKRIIVYQERPKCNVFRIGDGYHRSVEVYVTHKEKTIPCYAGCLRE